MWFRYKCTVFKLHKNILKWDDHSGLTGILRKLLGLIRFSLAASVQKQTSMFLATIYMKFQQGPTEEDHVHWVVRCCKSICKEYSLAGHEPPRESSEIVALRHAASSFPCVAKHGVRRSSAM